MSILSELKRKFRSVWPHLDERTRRITAANEALSFGYGVVSLAHRACGLSRQAIAKGIREIQEGSVAGKGRIRRPGAGRKSIAVSDPRLLEALEEMIEGQTRGDPESPLRWICKSTRAIAPELGRQDHPVSHMKVAQILHDLDYSLQGNRKTEEGADPPRPRRAVPVHQRCGEDLPGPRHSGDFGGHPKERAHRQLPECRPAMASGERAHPRPRP